MSEREQLEQAITALEAQRSTLGDAAVDAALAGLQARLAELEHAATPTALIGERKLVSVMFADISGFTALAETLDSEAVRDLMNACFEWLVPIIETYGGTVDKFIGDAIMALFGAPTALENDPERALRAALGMLEALAAFNAEHDTDLGLHFGINTGWVVAGGIGTRGRQEYSVMGDVVNLAARLEDLSERGEILVGPDTHRLTAALFEFAALEPVQVKGKAEPVPIFRLLRLRARPDPVRGLAGLRSPLIGRDAELQTLQAALHALEEGRGNIVAIVGEAGLGKSRLVAELRRAVPPEWLSPGGQTQAPGQPRWVEARGLFYTEGTDYGVTRQILRGLVGVDAETAPGETGAALHESITCTCPEQLAEIYPYLGRLLDVPLEGRFAEQVKYLPPDTLHRRILQAFSGYVRAQSELQPLVLVWEDLHWIDASSLKVLEGLFPAVADAPLLLLLAFRPKTGPIWDFHQRIAEPHGVPYQVVELSPLTPADSEQLVYSLLQIENLPAQTQQLILDKAEGNPFFLEELLRALIDAGMVLLRGEQAVASEALHRLTAVDVPDTLQGVIAARIDRLPEEDKGVLQMAAVVGRVFQKRVLKYLLDQEQRPAQLERSLGELRQREFIRLRGGEAPADTLPPLDLEYIFKHVLTQETAYNGLLIARRKVLHQLAGEAIEALFPEHLDELAATLAHHFVAAELPERAMDYLLKAGERALSTFALSEAIAWLCQAEQMARKQGWTAPQRRALEGLGEAYNLGGENEEALVCYQAALGLEEEKAKRAELWNKMGFVYHMNMHIPDQGLTHYERALEEVGEASHSIEVARIRLNLAYFYGVNPARDHELALEHLSRAQDILEGTDEQQDLALYNSYFALAKLKSSPSEAIEYAERALDICNRFGLDYAASAANTTLGHAYRGLGDWGQALVYYQAALEKTELTGHVFATAVAYSYLMPAYLATGRIEEAIEAGEQTVAAYEKLDNPYSRSNRVLLSVAYTLAGQEDEAAAQRETVLAAGMSPVTLQYDLACGYALAGRRDEAMGHLREIAPHMSDRLRRLAMRDWDLASLQDDPEFRRLVMGKPET